MTNYINLEFYSLVHYPRRVYWGNSDGEQAQSFTIAIRHVIKYFEKSGHKVVEQHMTLKQMRDKHLSFGVVVEWLLGSHIHFLITHPHQGLESSGLSISEIYNEVQRLKYHPGFPSLEKIECPIFCQDKWEYLQHLPGAMIVPTHRIPLLEEAEVEVEATETAAGVDRMAAQFPTIVSGITK
jgi:hypothetical protein